MTGSCLCGSVTFQFELPSLFAGHCHCSMCRRAHGAGFVTWVGVREDGFQINKGANHLVHYRSSDHLTRSFCGRCGSSMLCNDNNRDNVIDLTLANLDGDLDRPLKSHFYYDCKAGWIEANDKLYKRGGDTGIELLSEL